MNLEDILERVQISLQFSTHFPFFSISTKRKLILCFKMGFNFLVE